MFITYWYYELKCKTSNDGPFVFIGPVCYVQSEPYTNNVQLERADKSYTAKNSYIVLSKPIKVKYLESHL